MILIYNGLITNHTDFRKLAPPDYGGFTLLQLQILKCLVNQRHLVKEAEINAKINLCDVEFNMSAACSYRFWNQSLIWGFIPLLSSK